MYKHFPSAKVDLMLQVEQLVLDAGGKLREWKRSQHGFHATCQCCGGLAAITVSRFEIRELPHCVQDMEKYDEFELLPEDEDELTEEDLKAINS